MLFARFRDRLPRSTSVIFSRWSPTRFLAIEAQSQPTSYDESSLESDSKASSPGPSYPSASTVTSTPTVTSAYLAARTFPLPEQVPDWKLKGRKRPPRPESEVAVPNDHPLYAFFRKDLKKNPSEKNVDAKGAGGESVYHPFEPFWAFTTGRSWTANELRRKSFKDLQVLWYVIARERNLLATQRQTSGRYGLRDRTRLSYPVLDGKCRTTMARIEQVLNERRIAYLGAAKIMLAEESSAEPESNDAIPA